MDPWLIAAAEKGAKVRWVSVDPETLTLESERSRTEHQRKDEARSRRPGLERCRHRKRRGRRRREAHGVGAVVAVDAVHAAPHIPVDRDAIGADVITCSAYKFFGPHVGVTAIKRDLFEKAKRLQARPCA